MPIFRVANPAPASWNVLKTLLAIAGFDAIVLWGIPNLLLMVQHADAGLDLFFPPDVALGDAVLVASTCMVLWAGILLAIDGGGTPLPFDAPRRLVIAGPYAWLRTPMVTGTLGQVVGVGVITGSVLVVVFPLVIALLWNSFIRPTEEERLQQRFGRQFELYRRSVRCWLPMRSPWKPPAGFAPVALADMPDVERPRRRRRR